jgi:hypothetical protein
MDYGIHHQFPLQYIRYILYFRTVYYSILHVPLTAYVLWFVVKNFRQKRWFQFSHCKLSIHLLQHSSSTCIWCIYLSVDSILQSLWYISGFPWERVCANKEATEPRVPLSSVEVSLRKINGRHHDLFYRYGIYVAQRTTDMFHLWQTLPCPFLIHDWTPVLQLD